LTSTPTTTTEPTATNPNPTALPFALTESNFPQAAIYGIIAIAVAGIIVLVTLMLKKNKRRNQKTLQDF